MAKEHCKSGYQIKKAKCAAMERQNAELRDIINEQAALITKLNGENLNKDLLIDRLENQKNDMLAHMGFIRRISWWLKNSRNL